MASSSPNVRVVVSALERFIEQVIKKITLDIVANLLRPGSEGGTPVDTGWARSNWVPTLSVAASTEPAPQPGGLDKAATRAAVPGQEAAQQAHVTLIATGYKLPFGDITITNNVPYIVKLNDEGTRKAPRAFVQAAIRKAVTVDLPAGFGV